MRDTTLEVLAKVLKANPVGVCVYVDELKGWLNSFNKYRNGGGDKALAPVLSFADALLLLLAAYALLPLHFCNSDVFSFSQLRLTISQFLSRNINIFTISFNIFTITAPSPTTTLSSCNLLDYLCC